MSNEIRDNEIEYIRKVASDPTLLAEWSLQEQAIMTYKHLFPDAFFNFVINTSPERVLALIERLENAEEENEELRSNAEEVFEDQPTSPAEAFIEIFTGPLGWMIGIAIIYLACGICSYLETSHTNNCKPAVVQTR